MRLRNVPRAARTDLDNAPAGRLRTSGEIKQSGRPSYILADATKSGRRECAYCYQYGVAVRHETVLKNGARFLMCVGCARQLLNELGDAGVLA